MFPKIAVITFVLHFLVQSAVSQCTRNYTIQAGDICDSISAAQNVSTYQLATVTAGVLNGNCTNLDIGANICLGYAGQDCTTTYVVVANDTCESITSAYGINSTLLYGNNPQINSACTNIYIGEVLCVLATISAPPADSSLNTAIPSTASAASPATSSAVSYVASTTSTFSALLLSTASTSTSASIVSESATITSTLASLASESATSDSDEDDDDDDSLPYCDEL